MNAITLNPLAGAMCDVLQKHEREVAARLRVESAQRSSRSVRDIALPAAEQELSTAGLALQAAVLEYSDQVNDAIVTAVRDIVERLTRRPAAVSNGGQG